MVLLRLPFREELHSGVLHCSFHVMVLAAGESEESEESDALDVSVASRTKEEEDARREDV